jgi:hypothetical protein
MKCRWLMLLAEQLLSVQAKFQLGDSDTPEGTWVAGEQGELFEYKLLGVHKVVSGWSAVLQCSSPDCSPALPALPGSVKVQLKDILYQAGGSTPVLPGQPVLFVGELVDCETAAVYLHKAGTSLLISSNHEGF